MKRRGFQYGPDALEQVRFGFELAHGLHHTGDIPQKHPRVARDEAHERGPEKLTHGQRTEVHTMIVDALKCHEETVSAAFKKQIEVMAAIRPAPFTPKRELRPLDIAADDKPRGTGVAWLDAPCGPVVATISESAQALTAVELTMSREAFESYDLERALQDGTRLGLKRALEAIERVDARELIELYQDTPGALTAAIEALRSRLIFALTKSDGESLSTPADAASRLK